MLPLTGNMDRETGAARLPVMIVSVYLPA